MKRVACASMIAVALLGTGSIAESAPPSVGASARGPLWYAATLDVASGARVAIDIRWRMGGRWSSTGCFVFRRIAGSTASAGGYRVAFSDGTRTRIVARTPAGDVEHGYEDRAPAGAGEQRCHDMIVNTGARTIVEVLAYVAGDGTIARSAIVPSPTPGVRILAESAGTRTQLLREWHFDPVAYQRSTIAGRCETLAHRGAASLDFARSSAAVFETGGLLPAAGVLAGPPHSEIPTLLSVEGPAQPTGVNVNGRYYGSSSISFLGARGSYRFGVEALAAGWCRTGGKPDASAGEDAYVLLATADADFPACTKQRRIVARARDRHPICR